MSDRADAAMRTRVQPGDTTEACGCDTHTVSTGVVDEHVVAGDRRIEYCLYHRGATLRALFQYGTPGTRWLS